MKQFNFNNFSNKFLARNVAFTSFTKPCHAHGAVVTAGHGVAQDRCAR